MWARIRAAASTFADYIDGWKVHLANVCTFLVVLITSWGHLDATSIVVMGLVALSSLGRLVSFKPGPLSGATMFVAPNGSQVSVKPAKEEPIPGA
jgi:hypothetical protein